jgi:NADPH:quinone reductase-like Zn-dependent oxidoreductase
MSATCRWPSRLLVMDGLGSRCLRHGGRAAAGAACGFSRCRRAVLDLVAHRSVFAYRRALAPGGSCRCVGGSVPTLLRVLTVGWLVGRLTGRAIGILAVKEGPTHFDPLATLCVTGDVRIHIDRTFALDEVPAALAHVGEGRALSKVIVCPS